jgi:hypothetical protein
MKPKRDDTARGIIKQYTKTIEIITEVNTLSAMERYARVYFKKKIDKKSREEIIDILKHANKLHSNNKSKEVFYRFAASFILQYFRDDINTIMLLKRIKNEKDKDNKSQLLV